MTAVKGIAAFKLKRLVGREGGGLGGRNNRSLVERSVLT